MCRQLVIVSAKAVTSPSGRWVARTAPAVARLRDAGYHVLLHNPDNDARLASRGRQCFSGVYARLDFVHPPTAVHVVGDAGELVRLPLGFAARFGLLEPTKELRLHRGRGRASFERRDRAEAVALFRSMGATPLESIGDLPPLVDGVFRR